MPDSLPAEVKGQLVRQTGRRAKYLLLDRGGPKFNVSVRADNSQVIGFYIDRGYRMEGPDHAVPLGLRLVEGLSGPEIAARTGLTHGSVRVNLHRGMSLLRPLLAAEGWR